MYHWEREPNQAACGAAKKGQRLVDVATRSDCPQCCAIAGFQPVISLRVREPAPNEVTIERLVSALADAPRRDRVLLCNEALSRLGVPRG